MEVSTVSTTAYSPPPQTAKTEPTAKPEPKQASNEAMPAKTEEKKPSPVVNTQGQTTGRIVNTSA
jgi:hypothetical protein